MNRPILPAIGKMVVERPDTDMPDTPATPKRDFIGDTLTCDEALKRQVTAHEAGSWVAVSGGGCLMNVAVDAEKLVRRCVKTRSF